MADDSSALAITPGGDGTGDVQAKAAQGFVALHVVSAAAWAVRHTQLNDIPDVQSDDPDIQAKMQRIKTGVADVRTKLAAAQVTATEWTDQLCTRISVTIPTHIINYSCTYDAASDEILDLLDQAKKSGSSPDLIKQALELIGALQSQIREIRADIAAAGDDIVAYSEKVHTDHEALVGGVDSIHQLMEMDSNQIENFRLDIKRLQDEVAELNKKVTEAALGTVGGIFVGVLGVALCLVPGGQVAGGVMIGVGVVGLAVGAGFWGTLETQIRDDRNKIEKEQITKDALTQQLQALTALHVTVSAVTDQITAAQLALSDVEVMWGTFEGILDGVISDLGKPNADLSVILDEMWVKAAQNNWNKLADFAEDLIKTTVTVEVRPPTTTMMAA